MPVVEFAGGAPLIVPLVTVKFCDDLPAAIPTDIDGLLRVFLLSDTILFYINMKRPKLITDYLKHQ